MKLLLIVSILAFAISPAAEGDEVIIVVERVEVLGDGHAEARFYYEKNWLTLRILAHARGYIDSFELGYLDPQDGNGADILLVTRFASREDYERAEERFQLLMAERGPLRLLNDKQPADFRKRLSAETGVSLLKTDSAVSTSRDRE